MSKVTLPEVEGIVGVDCTHFIYAPGLEEGDEVDCLVCAEIKAARVEMLEKAKEAVARGWPYFRDQEGVLDKLHAEIDKLIKAENEH